MMIMNRSAMHAQDTRVEADMEFLANCVCSFEADVELRGSSEVTMLEGLHHPVGKIELILRTCVLGYEKRSH